MKLTDLFQKISLFSLLVLMFFTFGACGDDSSSTGGKKWSTAELIESSDVDISSFETDVDSKGNVFVVWMENDGSNYSINANIYSASSGSWGAAVTIETIESTNGYFGEPEIACDLDGNAVAVWNKNDGTNYNIYASAYTSGTWGTAAAIGSDSSYAKTPDIACDSNGNAAAVWGQSDGTNYNIYANTYTSGSWSTAASAIGSDCSGINSPDVAFDSDGNAVAVWSQYDGANYKMYANICTSGTWGTDASAIGSDSSHAGSPEIAFDSNGKGVAVWIQSDGSWWSIYANTYSSADGWGTSELIEDVAGEADTPALAIDSDGNAIAVFTIQDTSHDIYANTYTPDSGWGTAELIESKDGESISPDIAFDTDGNAIVVWSQYEDTNSNIYAKTYTLGSGWGTEELIENSDGNIYCPQIVFDPDGEAIAVWIQNDGSYKSIYSARYE